MPDNTPDTELKKWFEENYLDGDKVQVGQMLSSSECLDALSSRDTYWKERVREIIKCKRCNGQGGYLGASLGYSECGDCGGDGHCLYNREEEKLDTLLD